MKRYYMSDCNRSKNGRLKRRVGKKRLARFYHHQYLLQKRTKDES